VPPMPGIATIDTIATINWIPTHLPNRLPGWLMTSTLLPKDLRQKSTHMAGTFSFVVNKSSVQQFGYAIRSAVSVQIAVQIVHPPVAWVAVRGSGSSPELSAPTPLNEKVPICHFATRPVCSPRHQAPTGRPSVARVERVESYRHDTGTLAPAACSRSEAPECSQAWNAVEPLENGRLNCRASTKGYNRLCRSRMHKGVEPREFRTVT
jgi:hypothetical protein